MIRPTAYLAFICTILLLAGCKEDRPAMSVDEYKAHPFERAEVLSDCRNNPGDTALSANCLNASKADAINDAEKRGGLDVQPMTGIKLGGGKNHGRD